MSPKSKIIGLGSHGHVQKSENHANYGFSGFPREKSKRYQSELKQNNSRELLGHIFLKIHSDNSPSGPPRPQIRHFPRFSQMFYRNSCLPSSLVFPKRGAGAEVGVGMLRGRGTTQPHSHLAT